MLFWLLLFSLSGICHEFIPVGPRAASFCKGPPIKYFVKWDSMKWELSIFVTLSLLIVSSLLLFTDKAKVNIRFLFLTPAVTIYLFIWPHRTACGILVPQPGIKPGSTAVKALVLTTGPPGNSLQ